MANESLLEANSTAFQADMIISQKRTAANSAVSLSQATKLNATHALDATKVAQERVYQLKVDLTENLH